MVPSLRRDSLHRFHFLSLFLALFLSPCLSYDAPYMIPNPGFCVTPESPRAPLPPLISSWTSEIPGVYYVDHATGSSSVTYGTPSNPLWRIPRDVVAGDVVYVASGVYEYAHSSPNVIQCAGTSFSPIFITSFDSNFPAIFVGGSFTILGDYFFLENLTFASSEDQSSCGRISMMDVTFGCVRWCDVSGNNDCGGVGIGGTGNNIVVFQNEIHDTGEVYIDYDKDTGGVHIGGDFMRDVWVLENRICRSGHTAVSVIPTDYYCDLAEDVCNGYVQRIYIGRNVAYENREANFWTKQCSYVYFSENVCWAPIDERDGMQQSVPGIGFQYAPNHVYFVYNLVMDSSIGMAVASDSVPDPGEYMYAIGNVFLNIRSTEEQTSSGWSVAALRIEGSTYRSFRNNSFVNIDAGLNTAVGAGEFEIVGNSFYNTQHHYFNFEHATVADSVRIVENTFCLPHPTAYLLKFGNQESSDLNSCSDCSGNVELDCSEEFIEEMSRPRPPPDGEWWWEGEITPPRGRNGLNTALIVGLAAGLGSVGVLLLTAVVVAIMILSFCACKHGKDGGE